MEVGSVGDCVGVIGTVATLVWVAELRGVCSSRIVGVETLFPLGWQAEMIKVRRMMYRFICA